MQCRCAYMDLYIMNRYFYTHKYMAVSSSSSSESSFDFTFLYIYNNIANIYIYAAFRIRIWIHFGTGSVSTFSKCGSEDPDQDPLLRKGGSEDPDPFFPNVDPRIRIRIHVKMRWIRNAAINKTKNNHNSNKCS